MQECRGPPASVLETRTVAGISRFYRSLQFEFFLSLHRDVLMPPSGVVMSVCKLSGKATFSQMLLTHTELND